MQDMLQPRTIFTRNVRLSQFPEGHLITPGISANSLFSIYQPVYGVNNIGSVEKKVTKGNQTLNEQIGAGKVSVKKETKSKIPEDILTKMMAPTFHVTKLKSKNKIKEELKGEGSGEPKMKKQRTSHKF